MPRKWACACRKLSPGILVMHSAHDWATKNVRAAHDRLREGGMNTSGIEILSGQNNAEQRNISAL